MAIEPAVTRPVRVRFSNDPHTWQVVVENSQEAMAVDSETTTHFVAEYDSQEQFDNAQQRFEGMIPWEVLSSDSDEA